MAKPTISLRDARDDDAKDISALGSKVFHETFIHSVTEEDMNRYLEKSYAIPVITKELNSPECKFIVATTEDDAVVGFAQLTRGTTEPCLEGIEKAIELQRLYVNASYQGLGIGKTLVKRMEEIAKGWGFERMWLGVWEFNFPAHAVYRKAGYERIGEHDFWVGHEQQTDWILIKAL